MPDFHIIRAATHQNGLAFRFGLAQRRIQGDRLVLPERSGFLVKGITGHRPGRAAAAQIVRQGVFQAQGKLCGAVQGDFVVIHVRFIGKLSRNGRVGQHDIRTGSAVVGFALIGAVGRGEIGGEGVLFRTGPIHVCHGVCLDLDVECAGVKALLRDRHRGSSLRQFGFADLLPVAVVEEQTPAQVAAALGLVTERDRELSGQVGGEGVIVRVLVVVENAPAGCGKGEGVGVAETVVGFQLIGAVAFPLAFRGEVCGEGIGACGRIVGVIGGEGKIVHAGCPAVRRELGVAVDVIILADLVAVGIVERDAVAVPEVRDPVGDHTDLQQTVLRQGELVEVHVTLCGDVPGNCGVQRQFLCCGDGVVFAGCPGGFRIHGEGSVQTTDAEHPGKDGGKSFLFCGFHVWYPFYAMQISW